MIVNSLLTVSTLTGTNIYSNNNVTSTMTISSAINIGPNPVYTISSFVTPSTVTFNPNANVITITGDNSSDGFTGLTLQNVASNFGRCNLSMISRWASNNDALGLEGGRNCFLFKYNTSVASVISTAGGIQSYAGGNLGIFSKYSYSNPLINLTNTGTTCIFTSTTVGGISFAGNIDSGNGTPQTIVGSITSPATNQLQINSGAGTLYLGTSNKPQVVSIDNTNGNLTISNKILTNTTVGVPSTGTNGGTGDKIILYPGTDTSYPYSIGLNSGILWYQSGANASSKHIWYTSGVQTMSLDGSGTLTCTSLSTTTLITCNNGIYGGANPSSYTDFPNGYGLKIGWNKSGGTGETDFYNSGQLGVGGFYWYNCNNSSQNLTQIMTLDSAGSLSVNKITITGNAWNYGSGGQPQLQIVSTSTDFAGFLTKASSGATVYFFNYSGGNTSFSNNATGGAGQIYFSNANPQNGWTGYSDGRLKKNIKSIDPVLTRLCKLNPCHYDYIEDEKDNDSKHIGFLAQDLHKHGFKNAVSLSNMSYNQVGIKIDNVWGYTPTQMIPYLTKAIQELNEINNRQNTQIETLTKSLSELIQQVNILTLQIK